METMILICARCRKVRGRFCFGGFSPSRPRAAANPAYLHR